MIAISTSLYNKGIAASRTPYFKLYAHYGLGVAMTSAGTSYPVLPANWYAPAADMSSHLLSVEWTRQLDASGALAQGSTPVAEMTYKFENTTARHSPFFVGSDIHALISKSTTTPGGQTVEYPTFWQTPVRLQAGFGGEAITVFTGLIDSFEEQYGTGGATVKFKALDLASLLLKNKFSTPIFTRKTVPQWLDYLVHLAWPNAASIINPPYGRNNDPLFIIPYLWLDDEAIYAECVKAAASEAGYFFVDEDGQPMFRNSAWWATWQDSLLSVHTFTVDRFSDIIPKYDYSSIATGANVEYQGRQLAGEQIVWRSSGTIVLPVGSTTVEAKLSSPCVDLFSPQVGLDWSPANAGGMELPNVSVAIADRNAQQCQLVFNNESGQAAFIISMQLRGITIYGRAQEQVERKVTTPITSTNIARVSGNPYIQTKPQAELVADVVADRMQYPRYTYEIKSVPAIPWLQLGDRITITSNPPMTRSRDAIITKLSFRWSSGAMFSMDVQAVDVAGLFPYPKYFVIGSRLYGDSNGYITFR